MGRCAPGIAVVVVLAQILVLVRQVILESVRLAVGLKVRLSRRAPRAQRGPSGGASAGSGRYLSLLHDFHQRVHFDGLVAAEHDEEGVELVRLERAAVVEVRRQECPLEVGYCLLIELRGTARVSESDSDAAAQRRTRSPASAAGSGSGSGCGTATASLSKVALSGFSAVSIPPAGSSQHCPVCLPHDR